MTPALFVTQVARSRLLVLSMEIPMQAFWHVLLLHSAQLPFQYNMIYTRRALAIQPFSLLSYSLWLHASEKYWDFTLPSTNASV